jgi:VanZ family protein
MSPASVHRTLEAALARLLPAAVATGASIELLQWALPLGRVVSPVDVLLNACGAVAVGLVAGVARRAGSGGPQRVWAGA